MQLSKPYCYVTFFGTPCSIGKGTVTVVDVKQYAGFKLSGRRFLVSQNIDDTAYTLGKPWLRKVYCWAKYREPVVKHCHRHRGVAQSGYYEREEMSSQCSLVGFNSHLILIFPLESLTIRTLSHCWRWDWRSEVAEKSPPSYNLPTHQHTNIPTYQFTNSPTYQTTNTPTYQYTNLATYQVPKPIDSLWELGRFSNEQW